MALTVAMGRRVLLLYLAFSLVCVSRTFGEKDTKFRTKDDYAENSKSEEVYNNISVNQNDDDKGTDSLDGYEEIKAQLREILAHEVQPQRSSEEEDEDFYYPKSDFERRELLLDDQGPFQSNLDVDKRFKAQGESRTREVLLEDNILNIEGDYQRSFRVDSKGGAFSNHAVHHSGHEDAKDYMNEWIVHLTGGKELAASVAKDLGYDFMGQVGNFEDVYRLVKRDHPSTTKRDAPTLTHKLNVHAEVKWAEQQFAKERSKRAVVPIKNLIADNHYDPYAPLVREKRIKREEELERELMNEKTQKLKEEDSQRIDERSEMAAQAYQMEDMFNDEQWVHQWYLFDTRTRGDLPKLDLQVVPVWKRGIIGRGVRVLVLDDGLEWSHKDIEANYDAEISYDFNDNDEDPSPRYDEHFSNSHGTRCVGEIAMAPNNHKCGVGVAFGASVGGIRMLDGPVSDAVEGSSLGWALDKVDIISCSWGPSDDGKRVEGPGKLAEMALEKGIAEARSGKGLIYVWAAGNGGYAGDDCNCDGYTSSIYTLSISSASESGRFPWYGERCASTLATAYSSGAYTDQKISTTDLQNTCTDTFSGTSAAAPLAAGIIALALEANPQLTWRDMQHAVVWSSEWAPLGHNNGWRTNDRGLKFNPRFGFGLLSADGLVQTVSNWTLVPEKVVCHVRPTSRSSNAMQTGKSIVLEFKASGCEGTKKEVRSLEHVQVITSIKYSRRGALSISLTSPAGTNTRLLNERREDDSIKGFNNWSLMSVHTWGEDPRGTWLLHINDNSTGSENGTIGSIELLLHGTYDVPQHLQQTRSYRMPFEETTREVENESSGLEEGISLEKLRSMSWDELVDLVTSRTRSTFSEDDIRMLLEQNRLEDTLLNIQSIDEDIGFGLSDSHWRIIFDELNSKK